MPDNRDLTAEGHVVDAAATPTPWFAVVNDLAGGRAVQVVDTPVSETPPGSCVADLIFRDEDADHIVWMRNNLPVLLDELGAARAEAADAWECADRDINIANAHLDKARARITELQEAITALRERVRERGDRIAELAEWKQQMVDQARRAVEDLDRSADEKWQAVLIIREQERRIAELEAAVAATQVWSLDELEASQRPPLAAADFQRYLGAREWSPISSGPAGTMWSKDGARIAVPHELDDLSAKGVLDRIARTEQRGVECIIAELWEADRG